MTIREPRPHFHIVANRVKSTDYKVVRDWRDYRRSEMAIRELEQEFGLIQVQPSWEYDLFWNKIGEGVYVSRSSEVSGSEL